MARFGMTPMQKKDYGWACSNAAMLRETYGAGKHLVVSEQEVLGAFDSFNEAFNAAANMRARGRAIVYETLPKDTIVPKK